MQGYYRRRFLIADALPAFVFQNKLKIILSAFLISLFLSLPIVFAEQLNLVYDGNGNLITGDGKYREYNEFNQLIRVREGDSPSSPVFEQYIHHPVEDRILIKRTDNDTSAAFNPKEVIVYVNDNFVRRYDIVGTPEAEDTYYVKDEGGIVSEKVYSGTYPGYSFVHVKTLYYHNDHLGSTSVVTNSSGGIVEETFYAPYGEILEGGQVGRFTYEGREFSELAGDYDFRFRKYNPDLGMFTQPDALIPNVYDPQELNRYRFERNNPYKYVDEDGKIPQVVAAIGIAAGIGAFVGAGFYFAEVATGDLTFSLKGLGSHISAGALTGAVGGAVAAYSLAVLPAALLSGGAAIASQAITNVGAGKPISEGLWEAGGLGLITFGLSKYFPRPGIHKIKYPASFFTTKTGQQYATNIFAQEALYSSINTRNTAPQLFYNYLSGGGTSSNQINLAQQASNGGGGCICSIAPTYTSGSSNGVSINLSGGGTSNSSSWLGNLKRSIGSFFGRIFG